MSSLDELLSRGGPDRSAGNPAGTGLRPYPVRWWFRAVPGAAVLAAAAVVVVYALGIQLWYPLAFLGVLATLVLRRAVAGLGGVSAADVDPMPYGEQPPVPDGLARVLRQWQSRLAWDQAGLWQSSRTLHASLAELVDERLRQRRGLTRAGDPTGAREVLGERLWTYLHHPEPEPPSARLLSTMIDDVVRI